MNSRFDLVPRDKDWKWKNCCRRFVAAWRFLTRRDKFFLLSVSKNTKSKRKRTKRERAYLLIHLFAHSNLVFTISTSLLIDIHSRPQNKTPSRNDLHKATAKIYSHTLSDICSRSIFFLCFSSYQKKIIENQHFWNFKIRSFLLIFDDFFLRSQLYGCCAFVNKRDIMHKFPLT